ncbi:hypothetical protein C2G38_2186428 [Gigaspora rosea]|uniref:DUF6570 domain-containing protein n=1 Tax=Gigaspora rosea TaxID=44941 RepID=A0A397VA28_9GLOM|nr:hypothetical protein C2G38_2186428 [Gigaspora rosea]
MTAHLRSFKFLWSFPNDQGHLVIRENKTPAQCDNCRTQDHENKKKKRVSETEEQCKNRPREKEQRCKQRAMQKEITREVADEQSGNQETTIHPQQETIIHPQQETIIHLQVPSVSVETELLPEFDRKLLQKFRSKINKFEHKLCPICNECFPSIKLVMGECRRFYNDKTIPKKFLSENNIDPGDAPKELKGFTEIKEMLIAQIFLVISVYCLHGGQYAYRGNVINFPQDVQEFTTRLPRHPSSLDVLVVRRQSANGLTRTPNNIYRGYIEILAKKITQALLWLKTNNRYYANITIDNEVLQLLPENGPIDNYFQQIQNINDETETENITTRSFVPVSPPLNHEDNAINNALARIQTDDAPIAWPNIDASPVNEFHTSGYITRAFSTLYPWGNANLRAERVRDIKPTEYFQHMLKYKDGRFAQHTRCKYFALNSQMRWRALQEERVYIKQSLNGRQLTVEEVQEMVEENNHLAN